METMLAFPRLGEFLLRRGLVNEEQLKEALEEQKKTGRKLGETLVALGYLTPEALTTSLAEHLGLPRVELDNRRPVTGVPEHLVRRHKVFPYAREGKKLYTATADPLDVLALDNLRFATGYEIVPAVASPEEIEQAIRRWYGSSAVEEAVDAASIVETQEDENLLEEAADAPVIRLVDEIIDQAINEGASDMHIEPGREKTVVRFRLDGVLHDVTEFPRRLHNAVITRIKVMAGIDIAERRLPQDGRIRLHQPREVDLRVSTLPTVTGEKIVLRVLDKTKVIPRLESLGYSESALVLLRRAIHAPYGMILITGPTGSGKTTTLYAALSEIVSREINVVTVEDPPEYEITGVNQIGVNLKAGLTFATALKSILRQDPDVVMVGEIRDAETARIAVQAAMTGHLVLSTMHTNDAASAPVRLIDMGVEPYLVASSLLCVAAQRLVRKLCPRCAQEYHLARDAPVRVALELGDEDMVLRRAGGCAYCGKTGYRGRTAVTEVLMVTRGIREMIKRAVGVDEIKNLALQEGMKTLRQEATAKVLAGITTPEEVLRVVFTTDD
ncbi:type II secretion system protein E [Moorella thermoacetica]|uniref:Type II secretion system protein E n=1 Tax=Neomoorella thermoacetica TaxID=1525 RepID=A0A1J5JDS6_NEOTH|nr:GspE/PulE family protein [Moorella thermoacetica]OIQ07678.1 type II secretion system protein E [Moorella thermoacetica]